MASPLTDVKSVLSDMLYAVGRDSTSPQAQVSRPRCWDVGAHRGRYGGELEAQLANAGFGVHLPEGLFVLARVVDQGVALVQGVARGDLADEHGVVARA